MSYRTTLSFARPDPDRALARSLVRELGLLRQLELMQEVMEARRLALEFAGITEVRIDRDNGRVN